MVLQVIQNILILMSHLRQTHKQEMGRYYAVEEYDEALKALDGMHTDDEPSL